MSKASLIEIIDEFIRENGNQEITGNVHNAVLKEIVTDIYAAIVGISGGSGGGGGYSTPEQVRDALESLTGNNRLSATAIRNILKTMVAGAERALNLRGFGNVWASQAYRDTMSPIMPGDLWIQSEAEPIPSKYPADSQGWLGDGYPPEPPVAITTFHNHDWYIALTAQNYTAGGLTQSILSDRTKWYRIPFGQVFSKLGILNNEGEEVIAIDPVNSFGDFQKSEYLLRIETADNTPTVMDYPQLPKLLHNAVHYLTIDVTSSVPADSTLLEAHQVEAIIGVDETGNASLDVNHRYIGDINVTFVNIDTEVIEGDCFLKIIVTGRDDNTVRWQAHVTHRVQSLYISPT